MRLLFLFLLVFSPLFCTAEEYLGKISANEFDQDSIANPYGAGSVYKANGIMNPYSPYGNPYSNQSWANPYATDAPRLYDSQGNYRGKLSLNKFDLDSVSNPYGRYGNKFSPESVNNPHGAGNKFKSDSPTNPYGTGLAIVAGQPSAHTPSYSNFKDPYNSVSNGIYTGMNLGMAIAASQWNRRHNQIEKLLAEVEFIAKLLTADEEAGFVLSEEDRKYLGDEALKRFRVIEKLQQ